MVLGTIYGVKPMSEEKTPQPEPVASPSAEALIQSLPIVRVFGEGQGQIYAVLRPTDDDNGLTLSTFWVSRTVASLRQIGTVIERKGERMAELVEQFTNFTAETITNFALSIEANYNKNTVPPKQEPPKENEEK